MTSTIVQTDVVVRLATPEDSLVCGEICYRAFSRINAEHNFPCDFPDPGRAIAVLSAGFSTPGFYGVVVESGGKIIGSNILDERAMVMGVGPVSVDPDVQNAGVGRLLMQAVIDRANERRAAGIRLVQAAFHNRSLSLYASLGFDVREPIACMQGRTQQRMVPGCEVRPAEVRDLGDCNALARRVHGFDRGMDLEHSLQHGMALVVEREGRITGYTNALAFFGHATAETNLDMQALIGSAQSFAGPGILVPTRNSALFRWCLSNGLRVVQPMTLMSVGLYNEPEGAWLPSVLF